MRRTGILAPVLALLLTSCLNTRDVEPPATASSDWVSPTDYAILLANMEQAVTTGNVQNYLRCFDPDSLRFVPATVVYTGNQLLWDSWAWQDEQTWLTNVLQNLGVTTGNFLDLKQQSLQNVTADSLRWIGNYELVMNHTDTALTVTFRGQAELSLRQNTYNEWEIYRWQDYETAADSSWSRLKLAYVQ